MNNKNVSVVICCAGLGSRLGIGTTKALLDIAGKPLILHQLELLKDFDDIRIVVGHHAKKVIDVVKEYRRDVMFAFNYDYATTGPAASLSKGLLGAREYVITLDGDLVIKPEDFKKFVDIKEECIVISKITSDHPVVVDVVDNKVVSFMEESKFEWTGLAKIKSTRLSDSKKSVYEMLKPLLPIEAVLLETRGIDTKEDYKRALEWVTKEYCK